MEPHIDESALPFSSRVVHQRLKNVRPFFTGLSALIASAIAGVLLCGIGISLFLGMLSQTELRYRYDQECGNETNCSLLIDVPKKMSGRIELRYELTNFYQNHRRFAVSRIEQQLQGEYVDYEEMQNCEPWRSAGSSVSQEDWILPCGVFAISVFNDSFTWNPNLLPLTTEGITTDGEREHYQPLSPHYGVGNKWLETDESIFSGQTDERFIVWMQASLLSKVVKRYAYCENCVIEEGLYDINIQNRYPTSSFDGEKALVLATVTVLGTKNRFLSIAHLIVGCSCLLFSAVMFIAELAAPRMLGERPASGKVMGRGT
jgi:hypothetical protein